MSNELPNQFATKKQLKTKHQLQNINVNACSPTSLGPFLDGECVHLPLRPWSDHFTYFQPERWDVYYILRLNLKS